MNILRTVSAALAFVLFGTTAVSAVAAVSATGASPNDIPRVTIVAKRMTAAEKARFDLIERRVAAAKARHPKAVAVARKAN